MRMLITQTIKEIFMKRLIRHFQHGSVTDKAVIIVYARRLCSNWFRHGSTTISYPQCSLTFLRERYLHGYREQSLALRALDWFSPLIATAYRDR